MNGPSGYLSVVDKHTGRETFRSIRLADYCHSTPSIDLETGLVYMGDNSGRLSCWDINGAITHKAASSNNNGEEKEKEKEVSSTNNNNVLPRWDQEPLWVFRMGKGGDIKSTPAIFGDLVYATSWNNHIYALNKFTGTEVRKYSFSFVPLFFFFCFSASRFLFLIFNIIGMEI